MSIEQLQPFHQVRRIVKSVAPDFRVLANSNLEEKESVLDVIKKTIEVSDSTNVYEAVAILLFHLGHVLLLRTGKYGPLFGAGIRENAKTMTDAAIIEELSKMGAHVDKKAAQWAYEVFVSYWPVRLYEARRVVNSNIWSREEWFQYFSSL